MRKLKPICLLLIIGKVPDEVLASGLTQYLTVDGMANNERINGIKHIKEQSWHYLVVAVDENNALCLIF